MSSLADNAPQTTASTVDDNQIPNTPDQSAPDQPNLQTALSGPPQGSAEDLQNRADQAPQQLGAALQAQQPTDQSPAPVPQKPGLVARLIGSLEGVAQGLTSGGAVGAVIGGVQGAADPSIPKQNIADARIMRQARVQSAQQTVKFQSLQAAHLQADMAVQKIQTENLPAEIQQQRDAAGISMMKQMQDLGFQPAMITADTPEAHHAALAQMTKTLGGVPPMATLHIGGQLVSYDLTANDGSASYQLVKSMAPLMALPPMKFADFQKLSPEKKIDLAQQAATFWTPSADPTNIRAQIENYKSLKATYMSQNPSDTTTAKKFDTTIASLRQSGFSFLKQDADRKIQMDQADLIGKRAAAFSDTSDGSLASQLVEGTLDPSQLSKRGVDYSNLLQSANQYSLQRYGKSFDAAKAQSDYKFASNPQTQNTLKYLNSLTGSDNKSGNLGTLIDLSSSITRTRFPSINDAAGWARLQTGDPAIAQYHTAITEVADQVAKILQGGGSGTSDAKMKQAQDMFRQGFSKDQITGVATTLRELLINRKTELVGDNRYLQRQYGIKASGNSGGASNGATHVYDPASGTAKPIQGGK
jgi:hypothetical protein